jgi:hypothetical protein
VGAISSEVGLYRDGPQPAKVTSEPTMRMDLGLWSAKTIKDLPPPDPLLHHGPQAKPIGRTIAGIDEDFWAQIVYPDGGVAQVAETHRSRVSVKRARPKAVSCPAPVLPERRLAYQCRSGHDVSAEGCRSVSR